MLLIMKFNCFFLNCFLRIRFKIIKCFYRLSLSSTWNFLYFFQQFVFVPEKRQTFLLFPDEQHSSLVASSELWSAKFSIFFIMFRSKRHVFSSLLQRKKTYFPYQTNSILRSIKGSLRISFSIQFITFQCNIVSLNFLGFEKDSTQRNEKLKALRRCHFFLNHLCLWKYWKPLHAE